MYYIRLYHILRKEFFLEFQYPNVPYFGDTIEVAHAELFIVKECYKSPYKNKAGLYPVTVRGVMEIDELGENYSGYWEKLLGKIADKIVKE